MTMGQTNPFELIATALNTVLTSQFPQLKKCMAGWPDTKWLQTDKNKPGLFIVEVDTTGSSQRSQLQPFATDSSNIYYEMRRLQLLLQLTLVTSTPDERSSLGWSIMQYLITNYQLPLSDGQYSIFRMRGDTSPQGETNYYMRHMTFEARGRVLQAVPATQVTAINSNKTITGT